MEALLDKDSQSVGPDSAIEEDDDLDIGLSDSEGEEDEGETQDVGGVSQVIEGDQVVADSEDLSGALVEESQIDDAFGGELESPMVHPAMDADENDDIPLSQPQCLEDPAVEKTETSSPELIEISDTPVKSVEQQERETAEATAALTSNRADIEDKISEITKQLNHAKKQLTSQFLGTILSQFQSLQFN